MKARLTLYFLLLATCLTSMSKDRMKITFKDASAVEYNVESITDITFIESADDPVNPPESSNKVLVTRINDIVYTYDTQGRCTSMSLGDDYSMVFDYESMTLKMYNYTVGSFTLTSQGYFSTLTIDFMGEKANMKMEYNSEGFLTRLFASNSDDEYYSESDAKLNWENNLLVKIDSETIEKDSEDEVKDIDTFIINYSQQENKTNQWTLAMVDGDINEQFVTGMYGNAPARLPSSFKWVSESERSVSYTLNSDGSIKTETFNGETYYYYYASNASAASVKKNFRRVMHRITDKISER